MRGKKKLKYMAIGLNKNCFIKRFKHFFFNAYKKLNYLGLDMLSRHISR